MSPNRAIAGQEAFIALQNIYNLHQTPTTTSEPAPSAIPPTPLDRLTTPSPNTVLYLAYGSNLSAETFLGARGIKPVSSTNVHVPTLTLTFDLAGIPYKEPCFANCAWRVPPIPDLPHPPWTSNYEDNDYHKDRWHKGLVGVVYEVTREDYAAIIGTEGGGASYEDVIVPCFIIPKGQRSVDAIPRSKPFMAHTLLCPTLPSEVTTTGWRVQRPDPSYAQASARYMKLITDGAAEHQLPDDYTRYLHGIRSYTITTKRQEIGAAIFTAIWFPLIMALLGLGKMLVNDKGILPTWFATVMGFFFKSVWVTYDVFFKKVFGDGERTIEEDGGDDEEKGRHISNEKTSLLRSEGE